jgi:hypothetical protein
MQTNISDRLFVLLIIAHGELTHTLVLLGDG